MALACMVASGTGSLMFIDNVPAKSRMNSEVYRSIRSSQIQLNAKLKRQHNSGQMDYQNILQKQLKVGYSSVTMSECTQQVALHCIFGEEVQSWAMSGFWTQGFSSIIPVMPRVPIHIGS